MIYSELKIVSSNDLSKRAYVTFYFNGERIREYNGNNLDLLIKPNVAKSVKERDKLLKKLEFELQKALEDNNYPVRKEIIKPIISDKAKSTNQLLDEALLKKTSSDLSKFYKRNLVRIHADFTNFLSPIELQEEITNIKSSRIEEFLQKFNSSGTYYMNKRRDLGVLFSTIGKSIEQDLNIVKKTDRKRSVARLHKIYDMKQIKPILAYLKVNHPNLHICCLLSYGCFLRPHQEVRKLVGQHFKKDFTEIHLSGSENKGKRIRVVHIPPYVRAEIENLIPFLKEDINLFTLSNQIYNDAYFNTAWTRAWLKMNKLGLIEKNQTIYSFRHTAAVNVYRKTKDLNILQQLLGHSDMVVTLKYLRGLGEATNEDLKNVMPEL